MHKTKNDLSVKTRKAVIDLISPLLADTLEVALQAKQAHWNVKGPSFGPLHELFEKVADELHAHADDVAERIVQLGGTAEGTSRLIAKRTKAPVYPLAITTGKDHVAALSDSLAHLAKLARQLIETTDDADDEVTSDLVTAVARSLDKLLWLVESHNL
jgi:starvation-inducible DNA-binding protein